MLARTISTYHVVTGLDLRLDGSRAVRNWKAGYSTKVVQNHADLCCMKQDASAKRAVI